MSNYKRAKEELKKAADLAKKAKPNDKPFIRMYINNTLDFLIRNEINNISSKTSIALRLRQEKWLADYACKLHP